MKRKQAEKRKESAGKTAESEGVRTDLLEQETHSVILDLTYPDTNESRLSQSEILTGISCVILLHTIDH